MTGEELSRQLIINEAGEAEQKKQSEQNRASQQKVFNTLCDFTERIFKIYNTGGSLSPNLLDMAIEASKAVLNFKP